MKKASIVIVGNEILAGETVDTNAAHLSAELLSIGVPVVSCYAVGDEIERIVRGLELASADAEVVMLTGGLGPTEDDLTRQALAKFLNVELKLNDELVQNIRGYFARRNLEMAARNKIQAFLPAGAKALSNSLGTAPGIRAESSGRLYFAMPGVPPEMKQMFAESVVSELRRFACGQTLAIRKLRCFGAGESTIAQRLGPIMKRGRNPLINCTAHYGVITLHIVATAEEVETAERMALKDEESLRQVLGELVFGTGEQTLAQVVGERLIRLGKSVAVAESCTGGLLAKLITDVPGASEYFTHGWITYSNEAKSSELGVPAGLIERHGAVSEQVARAMARGAREKARTDFAIGITGIAGPGGATEQKPAGLVYISVDSARGYDAKRCIFTHERRFVRLRSAQTALNMLRLKLND
ncbi:MAG: competence/damage-inducible protein A [Phycisphaerales bacterium]|nr:MAG: competence/damage-inducible protein A [Phycisphaerales bacterium]